MIEILFYSVVIMLASLVGVFSVWQRAGRVIERNLNLLVSFSAGVFLVIAYQLAVETTEHSGTFGSGFVWIAAGALTVWFLFKFLPSFHHHHAEEFETGHHSRLDARRIMISDAIHNTGDGLLLAASFAVSSSLGALAALSIFVHELVQEMSEFFVLRQAGYSVKRALALNFALSAMILFGALGGFLLLESFEAFEVPLLGLASGAFSVVVFHDLIPHSVRTSRHEKHYLRHVMWFSMGAVLMFVVGLVVGH